MCCYCSLILEAGVLKCPSTFLVFAYLGACFFFEMTIFVVAFSWRLFLECPYDFVVNIVFRSALMLVVVVLACLGECFF